VRTPRAVFMLAGAILIAVSSVGLFATLPMHAGAAGARGLVEPVESGPTSLRIDVNSASAAELELLPRIGSTLAARIVEDRAARGPFARVEDLDRVRGIGPKTVELLRPHVRFQTALSPPERDAD
jgi:competence protein ComEA